MTITGGLHGQTLEVSLDAFENGGKQSITAIWSKTGSADVTSTNTIDFQIDTRGPILDDVVLTGDPGVDAVLRLNFEQGDLKAGTAHEKNNFEIARLLSDGTPSTIVTPTTSVYNGGRTISLPLGKLVAGTYQLTIKPSLVDKFDNPAQSGTPGQPTIRLFDAVSSRPQGKRIEFPEFLPARPQPISKRRINPGDKVVTKVARLYYFRDAHRVAQIINRTTKSLNRAAVDQSERRAGDARDRADRLTDERRAHEREAIRAAEETRRLEHQLDAARNAEQQAFESENRISTQLQAVNQQVLTLNGQFDAIATNLTALNTTLGGQTEGTLEHATTNAETERQTAALDAAKRLLANAQRRQTELTTQSGNLGLAAKKAARVSLETDAANARGKAAIANEESLAAQASEDRARENQFRLEVATAHEDPDTFAPAKTDSVDPVAQVSVSVIGEGLIQLRGPQKGVNVIRTMINQIDAPVGQVKVDIITVQLNGEKGERMEKPVGEATAYVDLNRFLTTQSLMLLRQAVQAEAFRIAQEQDQGGHYQVDRDRKYLYGWFGRDFIDELYEMDSEFLNSENKLLSLHSMDNISLQRALLMVSLAKNDVRQMVVANFMQSVKTELPQAEFDYRRASELYPHQTKKRFKPFNFSHLPKHNKRHVEQHVLRNAFRNAEQRYHFRNLQTFFGALQCGSLVLKPTR